MIFSSSAAWAAAPVLSSVSPNTGYVTSTTPITIVGSGLTGATQVRVGFSTATNVVVVSDTEITATAPDGSSNGAGQTFISVTTPGGTSNSLRFDYLLPRPTVISISPVCDTVGARIRINGQQINVSGVQIEFGGVQAVLPNGFGPNALDAFAPAGSGTVHVISHTNGGNSTPTTADLFTYGPGPGVGDVSPASGLPAGGTSVTISGGCFTGATAVKFGSTPATSFVVNSDGSITAVSPAGAIGAVDVTVTTPQGTSAAQAGAVFTYAAAATTGATDTGAATAEFMRNFFDAQGHLLLSTMPDEQRRIDRLNGIASAPDLPSALMGYLPALAEGQMPPTIAASTAAIAAMTGEPKSRFDAWFQSTLGMFDQPGAHGASGVASAGADYLVTDGLLIGGYVEADVTPNVVDGRGGSMGGTGWMAGPYATARLTDNLYLDILAGAGTSADHVRLAGGSTGSFTTVRWLASAALIGDFKAGGWTISPTARFNYLATAAKAYTDSTGATVPAVSSGVGQIEVGPAVTYRFDLGGRSFAEPGLRVDALADVVGGSSGGVRLADPRGRIEGSLKFGSDTGASLNISAAYSTNISRDTQSKSASLSLAVPMK